MDGITEVFAKIAELAHVLNVTNIKDLPGCWQPALPDPWKLAVNGHEEAMSAGDEEHIIIRIPPYEAAVWYNGWLAGLISPLEGVILSGINPEGGCSEEVLIAVLDQAIVQAMH